MMELLAQWDNFYVIVGSAAGALIGLQFVVLTLIAERRPKGAAEAGAAFASPTIVHFSTALFLSALLQVPWRTINVIAVLWSLIGLGGIAYTVNVLRRVRGQSAYQPVFEDWMFHAVLPLIAYGGLGLSFFATPSHTNTALFCVGASVLLLLLIGIHNAWDNVAYHVLAGKPERRKEDD